MSTRQGPAAGARSLTVLICTHDRATLLERTLHFLDAARRPGEWAVEVLVVANACTDATHSLLDRRALSAGEPSGAPSNCENLPLRWIAEPTPGKTRALNRAVPMVASELVAFVDDDHRVNADYLEAVCRAAQAYPDADILCGRILPDWDGSEPAWVHDTGPYRVYPLPVPRYDLGATPLPSPQDHAIPGGGNLIIRARLFQRVGDFAVDYGPVGHNLGGGEDQEWVARAIAVGARLQYVPDVVQHHYVDPARLRTVYLLRKAYERSASVTRLSAASIRHGIIPPYMVRKLARHLLLAMTALKQPGRRFHLIRAAASLGEIKGHLQARGDRENSI